jgi:hypothetical protein
MSLAQGFQATRRLQSPFGPTDFGRDVAPPAGLYLLMAAAVQLLRCSLPEAAWSAARFVNLLLVSLVTGRPGARQRPRLVCAGVTQLISTASRKRLEDPPPTACPDGPSNSRRIPVGRVGTCSSGKCFWIVGPD